MTPMILPEDWQKWRVALLDLDGTLYSGNTPIPGAKEFVEKLRHHGIRPAFVTNNSMRTSGEVAEKLNSYGIEAAEDEIFTSSMMAAAFVRTHLGKSGKVAALGQAGLEEALRQEGLQPVMAGDKASLKVVGQSGDSAGMVSKSIDAVVVGLDMDLTYAKAAFICRSIFHVGSWVLTNGDVRLPSDDGFLPGCGATAKLVETTTGIAPTVVGKPNPAYFTFVLERIGGIQRQQAVVIGDNVITDIAGAQKAGIDSILVESGVHYSKQELELLTDTEPTPSFRVDSVADLLSTF